MQYLDDQRQHFQVKLTNWYSKHQRQLPWRETKDPYKIWLSEIILQQTRVNQGLSYYLKFVKHYPTVQDLASATEEEVLKDWQGLGYYSRARNLHFAAKSIVNDNNGKFPETFESIKKLKGIGDYTAAAIASFAFKLPHAVVDGNVYRVLSRYFSIGTPIDTSAGQKEFKKLANELIDQKKPDLFNQAIMEFGALQCVPQNPNCVECPFSESCLSRATSAQQNFPVKSKKLKQRTRFLNYLILESGDSVSVNHRNQKGIWQNMYDFPMIETQKEITANQLLKNKDFKSITAKSKIKFEMESVVRKHILSHQVLQAKFYHFRLTNFNGLDQEKFPAVSKEKLASLPIPKLIENYLNEETNLLSLFD